MELNVNKIVFTTYYVIKEKSPIVYVSHDEDDDWQFYGPQKSIATEDGAIVTLGEILKLDPTLREIIDIPRGSKAYRNAVNESWIKT